MSFSNIDSVKLNSHIMIEITKQLMINDISKYVTNINLHIFISKYVSYGISPKNINIYMK